MIYARGGGKVQNRLRSAAVTTLTTTAAVKPLKAEWEMYGVGIDGRVKFVPRFSPRFAGSGDFRQECVDTMLVQSNTRNNGLLGTLYSF